MRKDPSRFFLAGEPKTQGEKMTDQQRETLNVLAGRETQYHNEDAAAAEFEHRYINTSPAAS